MSKKFIPNGDTDFGEMARSFAQTIAKEPQRFVVSHDDAEALTVAVEKFAAALQATRFGQRSAAATHAKEIARGEAEQHIRRIANAIRANKSIDSVSRIKLGLRERSSKVKQLTVPNEPPRLSFVRALHQSGAMPMHELEFRGADFNSLAKPAGAVRLELFADLIPPDEPIPAYPGANHGGRPWYLRSFTRSPIVLAPPMPRVPMRVVYWGRWADSTGSVGPFSATAVGWIEGGTHALLPGGAGMGPMGDLGRKKPAPILDVATATGAPARERTYVVAVLEAQYQSINPQDVGPSLPAPEEREQRQLQAPRDEEAAEAA